ncbi:SCO1/SenC-domain-containing protein [Tricharina praecox]|uniref:SCO1/SenC-domain-containing protein n=1 Tax=Tricharina praecox TaxID=43433 RepID=UPI00222027C9|nr:SCO1/SenC-domain-containing protein [Tricharina praecox]KAI5845940.1 SCO1/SenC-domain-containing protein [Tricharina praecox]
MNASKTLRLLHRPAPSPQCLLRIARTKQFHSSPMLQKFKTVEEAKARYRSGPFSWKAGLLFVASGVGLAFYFRMEKERMARKKIAELSKGVGRPKVGGPVTGFVDQNGKVREDAEFAGKYRLVYFGFTHCPDICPEELDKMAGMIDLVKKNHGNIMTPMFITCDPARDTPEVMKEYLEEFHPDLIGFTGTYDQIKQLCKAYRVYFSTPPDIKPGQDYLVDHSIYFYLMDPDGDFVEALGRQHTPEQAAAIIGKHVNDWQKPLRKD